MVSKNTTIVLAATAIVILAAAFVYIATNYVENEADHTYQITYELNGGVNSEKNPETYVSGRTCDLFGADQDELLFAGWFLNEDLTDRCDSITSDMSGDIVLYAKWTDNFEGQGFVLSLSGTNDSGLFSKYNITGQGTYKYLYYDESNDRYYMSFNLFMIYYNEYTNLMKSANDQYWSDEESGTVWTYEGKKEIDTVDGKKECDMFSGINIENSSTETQYIGDGWIPYYMTYDASSETNKIHLEYTYVKTITFDTNKDYNVTAYTDYGITVSGAGTYNIGDTVTLKASVSKGTNFKGWCDSDGDILSTSKTYSFEITGSDVTVYAQNDDDSDYTYEYNVDVTLLSDVTLTSANWRIVSVDHKSTPIMFDGISPTFKFDDPGRYHIYINGSNGDIEYDIRYDVFVNGDVLRSFSWESGGNTYSYSISMDYDDVQYYRDYYTLDQREQDSPTHLRDVTFVTYKDDYIVKIANDFKSMTSGMSDLEISNFVLAFTQFIEYQEDSTYMGSEEYWKFPVETLFDQGGDCEDTTFLYCAIMEAMGYDTALLLFPMHMAGGVSIDGCPYPGYKVGEKTYYYCETTITDYVTGKVPSSISGITARVITI